ncbi:MAG: DUF192 domain-containing protein [Candidatus Falkowbacteria bacterium]
MALNNKKRYFIILLVLIVFIFIVIYSTFRVTNKNINTKYSVRINNIKIAIEVASSPLQQYLGLSNRESLCPNCGMLFIFKDKEEQIFVMRDMKFPLDIVFIDDNKIINIENNLVPEGDKPKMLYKSLTPSNRVLELPGGFCEQNKIKAGDAVNIFEN